MSQKIKVGTSFLSQIDMQDSDENGELRITPYGSLGVITGITYCDAQGNPYGFHRQQKMKEHGLEPKMRTYAFHFPATGATGHLSEADLYKLQEVLLLTGSSDRNEMALRAAQAAFVACLAAYYPETNVKSQIDTQQFFSDAGDDLLSFLTADKKPPQYIHGTWTHLFPDTPTIDTTVRFVYDTDAEKVVEMDILRSVGWRKADQQDMADVEDSLKNANPEALDSPEHFGLDCSNSLPAWAETYLDSSLSI